jgi:hypothetical protein
MVRAHGVRTREFASLFGALDEAVLAAGATSERARAAHAALTEVVCAWIAADIRAEQDDLVSIAGEQHAELQRAIERLKAYAGDQASFHVPPAIPRGVLAKLGRCLARFTSLQELRAPEILLHNEAGLIRDVLDWQHDLESIAPVRFDPDKGFEATFAWALDACISREPTKSGARDIGLGEDALQLRDPEHPWARYPFLPKRTFACTRRVCAMLNHFEDTGPIGWAAGEDLRDIVDRLRELSSGERAPSQLGALADRLEDADRDGHAVIGWLQYLTPEAEGRRLWLVEAEDDARE